MYTHFVGFVVSHGRIQKGAGGPDPHENSQNIGFLSNTGLDPLKNYKAIKPAFNVWHSSARQQNAISILMAFCWRAGDSPLIVVFDPFPSNNNNNKKNVVKFGPPLTKLSGSTHPAMTHISISLYNRNGLLFINCLPFVPWCWASRKVLVLSCSYVCPFQFCNNLE